MKNSNRNEVSRKQASGAFQSSLAPLALAIAMALPMGNALADTCDWDSNCHGWDASGSSGFYNTYYGSKSGSVPDSVVTFRNYNTYYGAESGSTSGTWLFTYGDYNTGSGYRSGSDVFGHYNTAVGAYSGNDVNGDGNIAIGYQAGSNVYADNSIAIGTGSRSWATDAVAIGTGAIAAHTSSVAIGSGSVTSSVNSVSVGTVGGERTIQNVAAGILNTDAVNVGQMNTAVAGSLATANAYADSLVVGGALNSVAIGTGADALSENGIAIGTNAVAVTSSSVAIGAGARAQSSVAVGVNAQAAGLTSTAVGDNATASGDYAVALGNNATASHTNAVAIGSGSVTYSDNSVSVGTEGGERTIQNVAPGVNGTDAVNMDQLNAALGGMAGNAMAMAYTDQQVGKLRKEAFQGIAAAATIAPMAPAAAGETTLNLGAASYGGESAVGVAMARQFSQNVNLNAGVGMTGGKTLSRVGLGFRW